MLCNVSRVIDIFNAARMFLHNLMCFFASVYVVYSSSHCISRFLR
jgi:hypothetical protein